MPATGEKVVPWEDHYIIGQGFISPANVPVKGYATAFATVPLGSDLDQATPGANLSPDGVVSKALSNNEIEWSVAESYQDMAKAIAASASFGAKGFGYSGSGTAAASSRTSVSEQSIVGILSTRFESHSYMLKELPDLSTAALDVIAAQGAEGFYQVFGTDFVAGQKLGGSLLGIIDVRFKSASDKAEFSASVKASYKSLGVKAKGAAAFRDAIEGASTSKEVKVKWVAKGWDASSTDDFGGTDDPDKLLTIASTFSRHHKGVPVAAVLRPFTSHPQFVDAVFKREGPALTLPPLVKDAIIHSIHLEAIKINILNSTVAEFASLETDAMKAANLKGLNHTLEGAKIAMARLESDPKRLNSLAIYIEHRPFPDDLTTNIKDVKDVPASLLQEEKYQLQVQLQQAQAKYATIVSTGSSFGKKSQLLSTIKSNNDTEAASDQINNAEIDNEAKTAAAARVKELQDLLARPQTVNALGMADLYIQGRSMYKAAFVSEVVGTKVMDATVPAADNNGKPKTLDNILNGDLCRFTIQSHNHGSYLDMDISADPANIKAAVVKGVVSSSGQFSPATDAGQVWVAVPYGSSNGRTLYVLRTDISLDVTSQEGYSGPKQVYLRMEVDTTRDWFGPLNRVNANTIITNNEKWFIERLTGKLAGSVAIKNVATGVYLGIRRPPPSGQPGLHIAGGTWDQIAETDAEPLKLNILSS